MASIIKIRNLDKYYGKNYILKNLDLDIEEGEFISILGPSGSGKTTLLRMIAGFEQPTSGQIFLDGKDIAGVPAYERAVNTVFQQYALFPNLTIAENVAFGLTLKKVPEAKKRKQVSEMLHLVQLSGFENRMPSQLSGGQKQRVAIARALINEPKVLILDEPLSALDRKLRKSMQLELRKIQKNLGLTFIFVTHDQEEAMTISDRIAVMNGGMIDQVDYPYKIYEKPATEFVSDFIGESNVWNGLVKRIEDKFVYVAVEAGEFIIPRPENIRVGDLVSFAVRPEYIELSHDSGIPGIISDQIFVGGSTQLMITIVNGYVQKTMTGHVEDYKTGETVLVNFKPEKVVTLKNEGNDIYNAISHPEFSFLGGNLFGR